ncbi:hypothetical protein HI855_05850 [Cyanobacteria bacterium 150NLHA]|uniref:hypothetical protein n=1 Tax=Prochlorococcus sp. P1361 TaxID=2729589 RepID=UPI00145CC47C|nr:hypothetical protein [Prochlorococcus sp. P1361]NMP06090.1 hypothetical protein [Prochlorococcus sp. P1361]
MQSMPISDLILKCAIAGILLYTSTISAEAKDKVIEGTTYSYNCREGLWKGKIIGRGVNDKDWITIERLEELSGTRQVNIRNDIKKSCQSSSLIPKAKRAFGANCELASDSFYPRNWQIDYASRFNAHGNKYLIFAIRYGDGSRKLCLSKNNFRDSSSIETPGRSLFLHNIERQADSSIIEYEYHPGNGWGYEVKKYRLDLSDPERPSFSVVDRWIHQR